MSAMVTTNMTLTKQFSKSAWEVFGPDVDIVKVGGSSPLSPTTLR